MITHDHQVVQEMQNCSFHLVGQGQGQNHLPSGYQFPVMPLDNFITMWYCCGDRENTPSPPHIGHSYSKDMKEINGGKQKLCNMKKMQYIEQTAHLIGCSDLVDGGDQRLLIFDIA